MRLTSVDRRSVHQESTRARVRAWVLSRVAKEAEVEIPQLAREAIQHFKKDAAFVQALFEESLYDLVYSITIRSVGSTRAISEPEITPEKGDGPPPKSVFAKWMEHAGTRNVAVLNMTKEDLKLAEGERRGRGAREIALANLWRHLYTHMKSSDEIVADRFTSTQIEVLYRRFVSGEEN